MITISAAWGAGPVLPPTSLIGLSVAIVGAASLVAALTDAFASKNHKEFIVNAKKRIRWEFNENKDDERRKVLWKFHDVCLTLQSLMWYLCVDVCV
jgi:hypothetical protein